MSFWNVLHVDPTRKFHFLIQSNGIESDQWIWAKTIDKPSYEINTNEYQLGNHKFKYPGVATWGDITITIVDMFGQTLNLYDNLKAMGYNLPAITDVGIHKKAPQAMDNFIISQFNADGDIVETWTLYGAFIKSVNFGDLSYADDEMVEITMVVSYDYADLNDLGKDVLAATAAAVASIGAPGVAGGLTAEASAAHAQSLAAQRRKKTLAGSITNTAQGGGFGNVGFGSDDPFDFDPSDGFGDGFS